MMSAPDRSIEDVVMDRLVGKGSRRGSTWLGRVGDMVQQPPAWAGIAGAMALAGPRSRRAALRGSVCYAGAAVVHIIIKPMVGRSRPQRSGRMRVGPVTSSFPSGHAAGDLAFNLGAAQELPLLFFPLSAATLAAHWSLVRSRGHYLSDVLVGGGLGIAVALGAWKLWPPDDRTADADEAPHTPGDGRDIDANGVQPPNAPKTRFALELRRVGSESLLSRVAPRAYSPKREPAFASNSKTAQPGRSRQGGENAKLSDVGGLAPGTNGVSLGGGRPK